MSAIPIDAKTTPSPLLADPQHQFALLEQAFHLFEKLYTLKPNQAIIERVPSSPSPMDGHSAEGEKAVEKSP